MLGFGGRAGFDVVMACQAFLNATIMLSNKYGPEVYGSIMGQLWAGGLWVDYGSIMGYGLWVDYGSIIGQTHNLGSHYGPITIMV